MLRDYVTTEEHETPVKFDGGGSGGGGEGYTMGRL